MLATACTSTAQQAADPSTPTSTIQADEAPRNVILFIADGTGPATITMARDFKRDYLGEGGLALDEILTGAIRTRATDSRVTDSAAGATAFSTGVKTYNGAIAVDTLRRPLATLLEAAEADGMATGLVATSRITHATPASFAAHVPNRGMEAEIAAQMIDQGVDVIIGGGRRYFVPASQNGARLDDADLLAQAQAAGYALANDRAAFDAATEAPILSLLTPDHMAYEIDREPAKEPSLAEMTQKAIDLLKGDTDGFFLMVEGSRIDHAGHANDAAAHLHDMLAFDEAIAVALDFARADGNTLIVSTADHETGGLTLGRNVNGVGVYAWKPEEIAKVKHSVDGMLERLQDGADLTTVLANEAGIADLSDEEMAALQALYDGRDRALYGALTDAISLRSLIGWTTTGHTAVDVNLYAFGPGAERFEGNFENDYVGDAIADLLGFDLEALTESLRVAPAPASN